MRSAATTGESVSLATRSRLIAAAGEVFAAQGFQKATVREICSLAGANIAAVNYHFGDKTELYLAVIRESVSAAVEDQRALMTVDTPESALSSIVAAMLGKMSADAKRPAWHFRIMAHEMVAPTSVFARVVDEVIGPQYNRLRGIISKIIGGSPDSERTRLAAHSVIGQVIFYAHGQPVIERLWRGFEMNERTTRSIAGHIAAFSLCSLRAMRETPKGRTGKNRTGKKRNL
jgi:AcrR family transcriptional regulator